MFAFRGIVRYSTVFPVLEPRPYGNDQGRSKAPSPCSVSGYSMNICGLSGGPTEVQSIQLPTVTEEAPGLVRTRGIPRNASSLQEPNFVKYNPH